MHPEPITAEKPSRKGHRVRASLVAAGAGLGMTLAGLGIAAAQTDRGDSPASEVVPAAAPAQAHAAADPATPPAEGEGRVERSGEPGRPEDGRRTEGRGRKGPGHGHKGPGPGPGIHGEFTIVNPEGGYKKIATQHGEVTAVSATSLQVKSVDGFERTYVIDEDTKVKSGDSDDGVAGVAVGDKVGVVAEIDGTTFKAKRVHEMRERPEGDSKPADPAAA